jgi:hypothetical protein
MSSESPPDRFQQLWQEQERPPMAVAVDRIARDAASFRRAIRRRNVREYAASALVIAVFGAYAAHADTVLFRVACAMIIAATIHVAFYLRRHGSAEPDELAACTVDHLASHRRQLERQRDLLAGVWRWYLGPLVPGLVLFAVSLPFEQSRTARSAWIATAIVLSVGAAVFVGIARLNRMAARQLQRKIDALLPPQLERPLERSRS